MKERMNKSLNSIFQIFILYICIKLIIIIYNKIHRTN
jgi:hypothetical protein